jgi:gamma-glutamyl-gamma-aminobutyrate hydrolase PuuD
MKPVIGITTTPFVEPQDHGTFRRYLVSSNYVRAVEAAGGLALILPPQVDAVQQLVMLIDGLLLTGGADMAPDLYGEPEVHEATYGVDAERDSFELELFQAMMGQEKPIFGICRGIQVMNVALGGSLIQDLPSQHAGASEVGHRQHERNIAASEPSHQVTALLPDLLPIFDGDTLTVNSFHHQAIRDIAPLLSTVATSPDGLVEAVVMRDRSDVFAVQWHPELMFDTHEEHLRPFRLLVNAAAEKKLIASVR